MLTHPLERLPVPRGCPSISPLSPPSIPGTSAFLSRAEVGWGEEVKHGEEGVLAPWAAWRPAGDGRGGG